MKTIDKITDLESGVLLTDKTKESDGGRVISVTANTVEVWLTRSSSWYSAVEKCKCGMLYTRVYRQGKTDKLRCGKVLTGEAGADKMDYQCGSKTFTEVSREFTGVNSRSYFIFDKYFKDRFEIAEDISKEGLERWLRQSKLKIAELCKEAAEC